MPFSTHLKSMPQGWRAFSTPVALVSGWAAITALLSWFFFSTIDDARLRVTTTHDVMMLLSQMLSAAKDAETGQRGYLITQKPEYLKPYEDGIAAGNRIIKQLEDARRTDAGQLLQLNVLKETWAQKINELRETIHAAQTQGPESARALVDSDRGFQLMDSMRATVKALESTERVQRLDAMNDERRLQRHFLLVSQFTTLSGFGVLLYLLVSARRSALALHKEVLSRQSAEELSRERSEQALRTRVMNRELLHRTKNLISVVQAIVRHQAQGERSPDIARYIKGLTNRLVSLAGTMDILVRDNWAAVKLDDLIEGQLAHFSEDIFSRVEVKAGPKVQFTTSEAQMVGLALHELGTNAAKYGALSVPHGRIAVYWTSEPAEEGSTVSLHWDEFNGPKVVIPERRGFGSRITESLVARAVSGTAHTDYLQSGLRWKLAFHRKNEHPFDENDPEDAIDVGEHSTGASGLDKT